MPLKYWAVEKPVGGDWFGRAQHIVGGADYGLVVLVSGWASHVRKVN